MKLNEEIVNSNIYFLILNTLIKLSLSSAKHQCTHSNVTPAKVTECVTRANRVPSRKFYSFVPTRVVACQKSIVFVSKPIYASSYYNYVTAINVSETNEVRVGRENCCF